MGNAICQVKNTKEESLMSKALKNALIILLVALFAAVSLSACGKSEQKEPAKAAEAAKPAAEATKPAADTVKKDDAAAKPQAKELVLPKDF